MAILWRSWLTFTTILALTLSTFALLSYLQFNSILSELIVHRLSVVAYTTANSFRSVIDLGLPFLMINNAEGILKRGRLTDNNITAIHAFTPSGLVAYSTDPLHKFDVSKEILEAQRKGESDEWGVETNEVFYSGSSIFDDQGQLVGGIVVVYPKAIFNAKRSLTSKFIFSTSFYLFVVFSLLSLITLRFRLSGAIKGVRHLDKIFEFLTQENLNTIDNQLFHKTETYRFGILNPVIVSLEKELNLATDNFHRVKREIANYTPDIDYSSLNNSYLKNYNENEKPETNTRSLAESLARMLTPIAACFVVGSVLILGTLSIRYIGDSIEPEIASRTRLIGTIVNTNIQRAVNADIPLEQIVGAEQYLGQLLNDFHEVSYIGIASDKIILESGKRMASVSSNEGFMEDELFYPISYKDEEIGRIIIDVDSEFLAQQFRDVIIDLMVVILVAIMLTFESMVVMLSKTLTAPFERLQAIAALQASGDFSKYVVTRSKSNIDRISAMLSKRVTILHEMFEAVIEKSVALNNQLNHSPKVDLFKQQFNISSIRPSLLTFSNLNDIRWPLFLYVAADELPLSFFPLFTKAAENPWNWIDQGIVISLPLIGYLLAIFISSPVARLFTAVLGHRKLLLIAMAPAVVTHIGLYYSTTVPEIIFFRTASGFGYAIATLTYQDYVLDMIPKDQRTKSLGSFTAVLVGGIFCGTAIGGILADRLGQNAVFLVSATLVIISCLLILFLLAPQKHIEHEKKSIEVKPSSIFKTLSNGRFSALVFGIAIPANILMQAFIAYLVALYMNELGASTSDTGRTLMSYFLMIYFIGPISAKLFEKKIPPSIVTILGAVIAGFSLLIAGIWATQNALLIAVIGAGLGHGMVRSHQILVAMQIAETRLIHLGLNVVLGTLRTVERGGSILGLFAIAWLSGFISYQGAICVISAATLGGVLLFSPFAILELVQKPRGKNDRD
jgi:MFS family permease/methyl-accepting chemotaxis protein